MRDPTALLFYAGISESVMGMLARGRAIALGVVLVLVVFSVSQAYIRTRSWIPAIGAAIIGGFALWMVTNISTVKTEAEDEVNNADEDAGELNSDIENNTIGGG